MGGGPGYHPCPQLLDPPERPWAGHFTSLSLSFSIHNMGMMITPKTSHPSIIQMSQ